MNLISCYKASFSSYTRSTPPRHYLHLISTKIDQNIVKKWRPSAFISRCPESPELSDAFPYLMCSITTSHQFSHVHCRSWSRPIHCRNLMPRNSACFLLAAPLLSQVAICRISMPSAAPFPVFPHLSTQLNLDGTLSLCVILAVIMLC